MATDFESDQLNTFIDDEHSIDSSLDLNSPYKINKTLDKSSIKRPKPMLKCVVCGDHAFGYNFDAISCESCKAFFRRTALRPPGKLKCRGSDHCEVTVENRKRCKKCRLDKCFKMGMRKEWILSDEQKREKKSQIEANRRRKRKYVDVPKSPRDDVKHSKLENNLSKKTLNSLKKTEDFSLMTTSDWSRINQIQLAYSESVVLNKVTGVPSFPATQPIHTTIDLIRIPTYLASIRLITFIKKIPEFDTFDPEDRVTLVKYNLLAVVFMHTVLLYNPKHDTYHECNTEDPIFQGKDWIEILGEEFYRELTDVATQLIKLVQNDRVIIKTFLLLILFTKGFCSYDIAHEPSLRNHSIIFQTQNYYLESLYRYCLHHYGLTNTWIMFTNLPGHLLSVQRLAVQLKDYVHDHIDASDVSPLMQSVLQMTDSSSPA